MRVQEHARPLSAQIADDVAHQQPADRIEARGRLVEEHEQRAIHEGLREPGALEHALAVLAQRTVRRIEQVDPREQLFGARTDLRVLHAVQPAVEVEQLASAEPVVKPKVLR